MIQYWLAGDEPFTMQQSIIAACSLKQYPKILSSNESLDPHASAKGLAGAFGAAPPRAPSKEVLRR